MISVQQFFLQYTNVLEVNDFYKVESMRGTYITSQMNSGKDAMKEIMQSNLH